MNNDAFVDALHKLATAFDELAEALKAADAPAEAAKPDKAAKPEKAEKAAKVEKSAKAEKPVEYAEIAAAIGKLVTTRGRPRAVAVLADFGATNGKELKPAQYRDFLAAAAKETADAAQ